MFQSHPTGILLPSMSIRIFRREFVICIFIFYFMSVTFVRKSLDLQKVICESEHQNII